MEYNIQLLEQARPWSQKSLKKTAIIRSGFLDSPPISSHAYLDYFKLELSVREIHIIFTESYKSLFVSCQTSFMWTFLCSSAWFSSEIICFTQFWGNLKGSTKHCMTLLWSSIHSEELAQPSPKEKEPQLSLLSWCLSTLPKLCDATSNIHLLK